MVSLSVLVVLSADLLPHLLFALLRRFWGSGLGPGEIPARRWPALTTATPEGVVTSLEALSWPGLTLSSSTGGNPWSSSLDKAAVASQRHSLLESAAWVALGVPDAATRDGGLLGIYGEAC